MIELQNKVIVVTGGTGSLGFRLIQKLLRDFYPKEVRIFSRGEKEQVICKQKLQDSRCTFVIGDVRDKDAVRNVLLDADVVFHTAAMKHVPICEQHPDECTLTNIIGTKNVLNCAIEENIEKVIFISTDKASKPDNVYGMSKTIGEKMIISFNSFIPKRRTKLCCARFGNMLGSQGSVLELFKNQLQKNNSITVTDPTMTRFFMTVGDAVDHVLTTWRLSEGGEIFIPKMKAATVGCLAEALLEQYTTSTMQIIGPRPGEKYFEHIISKNELGRLYETDDVYIIVPETQTTIPVEYRRVLRTEELTSTNAQQMSLIQMKELIKRTEEEELQWN